MSLYWMFLTVPVAWLLQNIFHEASHLVVGKVVEGREPKLMIVWPHMYAGRFFFSRYEMGLPTKDGHEKWRHAAPLLFNLFWANVSWIVLAVVFEGGTLLVLSVFFVAPLVDVLVWIWGFLFNRPGTDGARCRSFI